METQNMETHLTISHISKRLPYGLKYKLPISSERMCDYIEGYYWSVVHSLETAIEAEIKEAIELNNLVLTQKNPFIAIEDNEIFIGQMDSNLGFDVDDVFLREVQPILFPLSSLTETITIKGKFVIPIVEILKKASLFDLSDCTFDVYLEGNEIYVNAENKGRVIDSLYYDFNLFHSMDNDLGYNPTNPQPELQDLLLEFHFDLPNENLIEKGLAISVFDLTENPYA